VGARAPTQNAGAPMPPHPALGLAKPEPRFFKEFYGLSRDAEPSPHPLSDEGRLKQAGAPASGPMARKWLV